MQDAAASALQRERLQRFPGVHGWLLWSVPASPAQQQHRVFSRHVLLCCAEGSVSSLRIWQTVVNSGYNVKPSAPLQQFLQANLDFVNAQVCCAEQRWVVILLAWCFLHRSPPTRPTTTGSKSVSSSSSWTASCKVGIGLPPGLTCVVAACRLQQRVPVWPGAHAAADSHGFARWRPRGHRGCAL
jgi:hypothetical protein